MVLGGFAGDHNILKILIHKVAAMCANVGV